MTIPTYIAQDLSYLNDEVEVRDIDGFSDLIQGMIDRIATPTLTRDDWQMTVEYLELLHESYFVDERSPDGEYWPQLAPLTIAKKGHARILIEDELLYDSLTESSASHAIREYGADVLEFGTNRPFAGVHQNGGGNIPQRMHTGAGEDAADHLSQIIADAAVAVMFGFTQSYI